MSKNGIPWMELGILGAVGIGAYFLWSRLQAGTSAACDILVGIPRVLCELGWQVTGGTTAFDQDKICAMLGGTWNAATGLCHLGSGSGIPDKDSHGCYVDSQHWCSTDGRCLDNAQTCKPSGPGNGSPGPCYEWSPTFGEWLYSPTMPGCVPYYEHTTVIPPDQCGKYTGMCAMAFGNVHSWIDARLKDNLCNNPDDPGLATWIAEFMPYDYAEVVRICNGAYDKPVSNIQTCPDGSKVDLNNPPGTTLDQACNRIIYTYKKVCGFAKIQECDRTYQRRNWSDSLWGCQAQSGEQCFQIGNTSAFGNQAELDYINCSWSC